MSDTTDHLNAAEAAITEALAGARFLGCTRRDPGERMSGEQAEVETWDVREVAAHLGIAVKSADKQLRRWGVAAVAREPGRAGLNLYAADDVRAAAAARPGRGRRAQTSGVAQ